MATNTGAFRAAITAHSARGFTAAPSSECVCNTEFHQATSCIACLLHPLGKAPDGPQTITPYIYYYCNTCWTKKPVKSTQRQKHAHFQLDMPLSRHAAHPKLPDRFVITLKLARRSLIQPGVNSETCLQRPVCYRTSENEQRRPQSYQDGCPEPVPMMQKRAKLVRCRAPSLVSPSPPSDKHFNSVSSARSCTLPSPNPCRSNNVSICKPYA